MPATAGRVRMPANNRVHSSAALQTHGIWQSAIGYDPYAPNKTDSKQSGPQSGGSMPSNSLEPEVENAYASFQGLLALARITGTNADEARGACKKCGRVGHLTFQCRNFLSIKGDDEEKDSAALQAITSVLDKSKANGADPKLAEESSDESSELDDESESADSDVDSEMERIIAARYGKKGSLKSKSSLNKKHASEEDGSDPGEGKRGRSKKRRNRKRSSDNSNDEDERGSKKRREKRRRHRYSDDEDDGHHHRRKSSKKKNRRDPDADVDDDDDNGHHHHCHRKSRKSKKRRSHHHSTDSDESEESDKYRKRKGRRAVSSCTSESDSSEDLRVGRGKYRSEKESKKHRSHK